MVNEEIHADNPFAEKIRTVPALPGYELEADFGTETFSSKICAG
jgi:hypothetical protein